MKVCDEKCFTCEFDDCIYGDKGKYTVLHGNCEGFGKRLKRAIDANNITQAILSRRTGIAEATITQYVHERACPRADYIIILCKELGVTSDWLLGINTYEGG